MAGEPTTLMVADRHDCEHFTVRRVTLRCRLLTRLFAGTLDARLASGRAPESGRLLAMRAQQLVSSASRRALADDWQTVVAERRRPRPRSRLTSSVPIRRDRVALTESEIRLLRGALLADGPVAARGVAIARLLLVDGAGPLFSNSGELGLQAAVRQATAALNPSASITAWV
jgi:hypothetical protein